MFNRIQLLIIMAIALVSCNTITNNCNNAPINLTCELESNPLAIDNSNPAFGWQTTTNEKKYIQSAYQVILASNPDSLSIEKADMWNSGKVVSSQSQYIIYGGKPLQSAKRYYYSVQTFDTTGKASGLSKPAVFETGIIKNTEWKAQWIKAPKNLNTLASVLFRNEINISKKIQQARVYASGLGAYTIYINGQRLGNQYLAPNWTVFGKRVQYQTYDASSLLQQGKNAIGSVVTRFWAPNLEFIFQLKVEYTDGSTEWFYTDNNWKVNKSAITDCSYDGGEKYNATLEMKDWNTINFKASDWQNVECEKNNKNLVSQQLQPIIVKSEIKPKAILKTKEGKIVFDFGETLPGWVKIISKGTKGKSIQIKYFSTFNSNEKPSGKLVATDEYIPSSENIEWEPEFAYHTFRFAEVTGLAVEPDSNSIIARVAYPDVQTIGQFKCSNELLNKIYEATVRTGRNNLVSTLTGMPDAKSAKGSPVSTQAYSSMALYSFDMGKAFAKYMNDLKDMQSNNGSIHFPSGEANTNSAGWPDVFIQLPWKTFAATGDKRLLTKNYEAMKAWLDARQRESDAMSPPYMYNKEGNGDLYSLVKTSTPQIASTYYFYASSTLSQIAAAIGNPDDETVYMELAGFTKDQFNQSFLTYRTARYWNETQTAHVLPLAVGLTPLSHTQRVTDFIANDIKKNNIHPTTGILATQFLLPLLSENNYHELAYQLLTQTSKPSWGYMIEKGSSTIWGSWDGVEEAAPYQLALASAGEWLYSYLLGIRPDPKSPGYKHSIIDPNPAGDLKWVEGSLQTAYGLLRVKWEKLDNGLNVSVSIPASTSSTLTLPVANYKTTKITMNGVEIVFEGKATKQCPRNIKFNGFDANMAVIDVESGDYDIKIE